MKSSLLCCAMISLIGLAPAYADVLSPDHAMLKANDELRQQFFQEAKDLEILFNDLVVSDLKRGISTHRFKFPQNQYNEEAITLFKNNAEVAGWDIYDNKSFVDFRILTLVRSGTVLE